MRRLMLLIAVAAAMAIAGCMGNEPGCGAGQSCRCYDPSDSAPCDGRCLTIRSRQGELRCLGPVR